MPPEDYVQLLLLELRHRSQKLAGRRLKSIYFGGGTPSLVAPSLIVSILDEVSSLGFDIDQRTEITIEINPATVSKDSLQVYLDAGVNRFSVGAQTFDDQLLKVCGREHNAAQTRETLELLNSFQLNYTFDLLFALPGQTLKGLENDLAELHSFKPKHLSAYCLTVPSGHPMSKGRPPEAEQVEMFDLIKSSLETHGFQRYEISNFALSGFESVHNFSYWDNSEFWGIGLSSHSYLRDSAWGTRFWNPKTFDAYKKQVQVKQDGAPYKALPEDQVETLQLTEALTDICHMHLRTQKGLPIQVLVELFPKSIYGLAHQRLEELCSEGLIEKLGSENATEKVPSEGLIEGERLSLSEKGVLVSNKVFERLTFLPSDIS